MMPFANPCGCAYQVLKDIFKYYAARGHTDAHLFSIDWGAFTELAYKAKLKCKRVPLHVRAVWPLSCCPPVKLMPACDANCCAQHAQVLDSIFINTNAANMGQPMNPERALVGARCRVLALHGARDGSQPVMVLGRRATSSLKPLCGQPRSTLASA